MPGWAWGIVGVAVFLALGLAVLLVFGLLGTPGGPLHRAAQRLSMRRSVYRGVELPTEAQAPEERREELPSPDGERGPGS